ncbi:tetratricopeptide repeat-containing protein [Gymnopilus junonius]|uniref:Tetratricopeptide repeat-containing protein n=1 Tax=Gymnopilus junonius TaxID=109634 RepID=A0A9P5TQE2_GYMJU|nr:tetratricopeptide repeat-containing protein [Gymnopilus junonius]
MAAELKPLRKRDKLKNFFSRSLTPQPRDSSPNVTASRPSTPNASHTSNVALSPDPRDRPVKARKAFTKGQSLQKDLAILSTSYVLQEASDLKELLQLIVLIHDNDEEDKLADVLESCARFSVQLASAPEADRVETTKSILVFGGTVEKIRKAQLSGDAGALDGLSNMVGNVISTLKPSFLRVSKAIPPEGLSRALDVAIGQAVSVLSIVKEASSLIPVPWVQPAVGLVVSMLQAVSQTRTNYNDMKEIAATAGEFVISCAVVCSESINGPSSELRRALNKFTKKLETIAQECSQLSNLGVFSRYFQQAAQAGDLQAVRMRLTNAIELFQNEALINIKLDIETLKRNIDFAALNNLPSHPLYAPNEYLENSRDDVLKDVSEWITNSKESVLWIHGAAGLGKSTVAQQLIYLLQSDDRLAGGHPQTISNIADVARKLNSAHDPLSEYMVAYIIDPIRALKYPYQLVIVIDGLDEWPNRETFLAELAHISTDSPVKFILTSRFNYSIERVLDKALIRKYPLPQASQEVIEHYFHHHFDSDDIDWRGRKPDQRKISRLATLADGLLIWAATVRSLVLNNFDGRDPHEILDQIVWSEQKVAAANGRQLEDLYRSAISSLFPPDIQPSLRDFLGATLSEIISPAIQSFHSSFLEFIQSITVEPDKYSFRPVSITDANFLLGNRCLKIFFLEFLPSFPGQKCTYSDLRGITLYCLKFWPMHLSCGTERKQLPTDSILVDCVSDAALQRWSMLFLPHVSSRFRGGLDTYRKEPKAGLLHELAITIGKEDTSTLSYHISCLEVAVRLQPNDQATWVALGQGYRKRYMEEIIVWPLELRPTPHPDRSSSLNNLAIALHSRFQQQGALNDLDEAIFLHREALELRLGPHPERFSSLSNLANRGALGDLDKAISLHLEALELCPAIHPNRSASLNSLANALHTRFRQQGALSDLDKAITFNREALALHPAPHPDPQGALSDLDEAISLHREGLGLRPAPNPNRSFSLDNLANTLRALSDLDEAIFLHREALVLRPALHPSRSLSLDNLAIALQIRFQQQGALSDLSEAISLHREALELRPAPNPNRPLSLDNLATALHTRFEQQGTLSDFEEAISLHREALHLRPASDPGRWMSLRNIANTLDTRFTQQGALSDLDEATSLYRQVLEFYYQALNNLAGALCGLSYLDEAVSLFRRALEFCPAPNPDHGMALYNLAYALLFHSEQQGGVLHFWPITHPNYPAALNNLANVLWTRFKQQGAPSDLNEAISLARKALELVPLPNPAHSVVLDTLASILQTQFEQQGVLSDLDEAVALNKQALDLRPTSHPLRFESLNRLAEALQTRFERLGVLNDLDQAISLNKEAITLCRPSQLQYGDVLQVLLKGLELQFKKDHTPELIDEIVIKYRELLELPTAPKENHSWALKNFPLALRARHELKGDQRDLDEAAEIEKENK